MENIYTRIGQKRKEVEILTIEKSRLDRIERKNVKDGTNVSKVN
jgi:hypothetical protein